MRIQSLQAACSDGLAVATVERQRLLQEFVGLLPPRCAEAHREGILARNLMEQLPEHVLTQVGDDAYVLCALWFRLHVLA